MIAPERPESEEASRGRPVLALRGDGYEKKILLRVDSCEGEGRGYAAACIL